MLAMTDTPIEGFLPVFASTGIPVAFWCLPQQALVKA